MRNVNNLYAKVGFNTKISSKSAKVLGTSLAFELGMSNDQVMLLGRWKNPATAQYYRSVDPSTLLDVFSKIVLNPTDLESLKVARKKLVRKQRSLEYIAPSAQSYSVAASQPPALQSIPAAITSMIPSVYPQFQGQDQVPNSTISTSSNCHLAWQFLISAGFIYPGGAPVMQDGFPLPTEVPELQFSGEDDLTLEENNAFVIRLN